MPPARPVSVPADARVPAPPASPGTVSDERLCSSAREALEIEAQAIRQLIPHIGDDFARACRMVLECRGRVVVSGIGKSGHIARKIAATLASTGTPAFFVHPAEASHGDLGMITREDLFIALSNSGTTAELLLIVPSIKRVGARLLALTGQPQSTLAGLADCHLYAGSEREACPMNLAPTASTTAALAMGDALAVAILNARGFGSEDFARSHPGGALGRRLLTLVRDVMRTGEDLPVVPPECPFADALLEVTRKRMGMVAIISPDHHILGIFTDGDLRRMLDAITRGTTPPLSTLRVCDVMTARPVTVAPGMLAAEAVRIMEERRITQLLVSQPDGTLAGALHLHDLLMAGVV